jgi:hypothetical protein
VTVRMGVVVGMAMSMQVRVNLGGAIVPGGTVVIVLVRPDVRVGMAQGAVTVQLAVEQFVSGGGHAGSSLGRQGQVRALTQVKPRDDNWALLMQSSDSLTPYAV